MPGNGQKIPFERHFSFFGLFLREFCPFVVGPLPMVSGI